jgi:hypothetical protein
VAFLSFAAANPNTGAATLMFGATINLQGGGVYDSCAGGALDPCNAAFFDGLVSTWPGAPIRPAEQLQKVYLQPDDGTGVNLPATPAASWQAFAAAGGRLFVSIKPQQGASYPVSAAEDNFFVACVQGMVTAFGVAGFKLTLWQEPNGGGSFPSAAAYQAYVAHYYPLVKLVNPNITVVYDPGGGNNFITAYYPGDQYVDEIAIDYYGNHWLSGFRLDPLAALADGHTAGSTSASTGVNGNGAPAPIPFGLGEWGNAASGGGISTADYAGYMSYLTSFFTGRALAGKANGWIIFFGYIAGNTLGVNGIANATDYKLPSWQTFYSTVTAASASLKGAPTMALYPFVVPPALTNPMTGTGDMIIGGVAGAPQRLAAGVAGEFLGLVSGSPAWADTGMWWNAADGGLLAQNFDPTGAPSTIALTAGTVYLSRINIRAGMTVNNVWYAINTVGAGASTGCFVGLYNSAGTLLSASADQGAVFAGTTGPKSAALGAAQTLAAGTFVWAAMLCNLATTQVAPARSAANTVNANVNLAAAQLRFATNATVQTTLPATITPASNVSPGSINLWMGVS